MRGDMLRLKVFLVLLLVSGVGSILVSCQSSITPMPGTLRWRALQARQNGKTSLRLPAPISLWAVSESLADSLRHTTTVVAQLIASATSHDDYDIYTWRKYRIVEKLSVQPRVPNEPLPKEIPPSLLPLGSDEFVMAASGGAVDIDGVNITQDSEIHIPAGKHQHLIFALFRASGSFALFNYGPSGLFSIDESGTIHASEGFGKSLLESDLLRRTGGNLSTLRSLSAEAVRHP